MIWVDKKTNRDSDVQRHWLLYKRREGSRNSFETQGRTGGMIAHLGIDARKE